jgi:SAM-dependent methyltransferase
MTSGGPPGEPGHVWNTSDAAAAWQRGAEARNRWGAPATEVMLDLAGVRAGARVLDLGTGTGDTALLASGRVGASGHVLATDLSPAMIELARAAAAAAHADNVTARVMSAEDIDVEPSTFDAVIARLALMFVGNLERALEGVARALRAGGRFATITWSSLERNPFHRILIEAARAQGPLPEPPPEIVRAFSLHDAPSLERALARAGFVDVVVRAVPATRSFGSAAEAVASAKDSPAQAALFSAVDGAGRERAFAQVEARFRAFEANEACVFTGELLVAAGARPEAAAR